MEYQIVSGDQKDVENEVRALIAQGVDPFRRYIYRRIYRIGLRIRASHDKRIEE